MILRSFTLGLFALLLAGCMQSNSDLFAASEKVTLPVSGSWQKVSGYLRPFVFDDNQIGDSFVIHKFGTTTYSMTGTKGSATLSFVPLDVPGHHVVVLAKSNRTFYYYLVRRVGEDMFAMDMGCPADHVAGVSGEQSSCRVNSRAAVLAAAYHYLSDPKNLDGTGDGILYRRTL